MNEDELDDMPIYERFRVTDRQDFVYPNDEEEEPSPWDDPVAKAHLITMMSEFIKQFASITPLQQAIVSQIIMDPGIKFGDLCERVGFGHSWVHINCIKLCEFETFKAIMPNKTALKWRD